LRDELHLTGSKEGCSSGDCGACSVTVDGRLVCSCLMFAVEAEGQEIEKSEGMARGHDLHPLQRKFLEHAALQCGFCTPGLLVAAKALLDRNRASRTRFSARWLSASGSPAVPACSRTEPPTNHGPTDPQRGRGRDPCCPGAHTRRGSARRKRAVVH